MERETAIAVAHDWAWGHTGEKEHDRAQGLIPRVAQVLFERLPSGAIATPLDYEGSRVVAAVADEMLIIVRPDAAQSEMRPQIESTSRRIDPRDASITITDTFRGGYDGSGQTSGWRFDLRGFEEIELPWDRPRLSRSESEGQEAFAVALARAIGLDLPSAEPGSESKAA
jgi:hypothetical protein